MIKEFYEQFGTDYWLTCSVYGLPCNNYFIQFSVLKCRNISKWEHNRCLTFSVITHFKHAMAHHTAQHQILLWPWTSDLANSWFSVLQFCHWKRGRTSDCQGVSQWTQVSIRMTWKQWSGHRLLWHECSFFRIYIAWFKCSPRSVLHLSIPVCLILILSSNTNAKI